VYFVVLALVGGLVLGVATTLVILRIARRGKPEELPRTPAPEVKKDLIERAFDAAEAEAPELLREGGAFIFGLPPKHEPQEEPNVDTETTPERAGQIVVENHPCDYLTGEIPRNYKPSECSGLCLAPGQRGRPCFWASSGASKCPYFKPRVRPTRVKLRRVG
jgi:hypothetical protein